MYQPPHHREDRLDVQHSLIRSHPLGLLISTDPEGLLANAIPFLLQPSTGAFGTLQAHMARGNGQWRNLDGQNVLVVFQGPQAYVSPSFYETKRETGKVVPTWNYAMVQARGIAKVHADAAWLEKQIMALTSRHEGGRSNPWAVSDAPRSFIESQLKGIIGVEIEIHHIEGKWKVSQNRPEADRRGVAEGLSDDAPAMVELVRRYGNV
jgi:transcriptional regulator